MHKLNYLQHREEKVAGDLALIASLLHTSRLNNTIGDMGASYSSQPTTKMSTKELNAKMAASAMLKRTARSKCKQMHRRHHPVAVCCCAWCSRICSLLCVPTVYMEA